MKLPEHFQESLNTGLAIDEAIRRIAEEAGFEAGVDDVTKLAAPLGVHSIVRADIGPIDGYVDNTFKGLTITVNKNSSYTRQRFSLAHELAHVLLGDESGHRENSSGHHQHERLCDAIAAELLMPIEVFGAALGDSVVEIADIERLAVAFGTSAEATACRAAELSQTSFIVTNWAIRENRSGRYPVMRYARRSNWASFPYLPKNFVPPKQSSPAKAARGHEIFAGREALIPLTAPADVESKRFGLSVLSIIRPATQ